MNSEKYRSIYSIPEFYSHLLSSSTFIPLPHNILSQKVSYILMMPVALKFIRSEIEPYLLAKFFVVTAE